MHLDRFSDYRRHMGEMSLQQVMDEFNQLKETETALGQLALQTIDRKQELLDRISETRTKLSIALAELARRDPNNPQVQGSLR